MKNDFEISVILTPSAKEALAGIARKGVEKLVTQISEQILPQTGDLIEFADGEEKILLIVDRRIFSTAQSFEGVRLILCLDRLEA